MKRITVTLPDELADRIDQERRRRDVSAATVIREAVEAQVPQMAADRPKRFSFIGIAKSGSSEPIAANMEEILNQELASREALETMMYGAPLEVIARENRESAKRHGPGERLQGPAPDAPDIDAKTSDAAP